MRAYIPSIGTKNYSKLCVITPLGVLTNEALECIIILSYFTGKKKSLICTL